MIQPKSDTGDLRQTEESFQAALAKTGAISSPADLQATGIQKLRVLSESQLQRLAEVAVNRALRGQLAGLSIPSPAFRELEQRSRAEYQRLVAKGLEIAPRAPAAKVENFGGGNKAPGSRGPVPADVQAPPADGATTAAQPALPARSVPSDIEVQMVSHVSQLLSENWRSELRAVESSQREHLLLLEERIAKLVRALDSTDQVLARLKTSSTTGQSTGSDDAGEVANNGAAESGTPLGLQKNRLLDAIFQANMELRQLRDGAAKA